MTQTLEAEKFIFPEIAPATDAEIVAYLRYSCKFAEIAALAERDALVLNLCERLGITVSDEEWQAAGDAFRAEHKLFGVAQTNAWLSQQRITVDEWSEGIRIQLLTKQLKEHLFGADVDGYYLSNRDRYRRVALSQILVLDEVEALKIVRMLREENASFCALALEYSKGKKSQENGGFVGIRFLAEIMPEIAQAISTAQEGEAIGPIQTKLGYHIFRVEKWFLHQLSESAREQILESLFQAWLKEQSSDRL
jgi:parvulin-like peptidyl-prolyl isomerase